MTGTSNAYSSVLRNVANIATVTLSLITTHVRTILRVKTLKHQSLRVKRHRNIGNGVGDDEGRVAKSNKDRFIFFVI